KIRNLEVAEKLLNRCHSEEQQRRRISHGLENTQSEILRCAQDDSVVAFSCNLLGAKILTPQAGVEVPQPIQHGEGGAKVFARNVLDVQADGWRVRRQIIKHVH